MFDHHSVKHTRGGILVLLPFFPVLGLGNPVGALGMLVPLFLNFLGQLILSGTGRTEFGVERPAAPSGLNNKNGLLQPFLHIDSEGELGANLAAIHGGLISTFAKAGGQLTQPLAIRAAIIRAGQIGHPDFVTYPRSSIGIAHVLEDGCRQRILTDVVKRADRRMPLHVRLTGEDEDFQRPGGGCGGGEECGDKECGEGFHRG